MRYRPVPGGRWFFLQAIVLFALGIVLLAQPVDGRGPPAFLVALWVAWFACWLDGLRKHDGRRAPFPWR